MLYIILLLILAVLLFGSSAVLGAIGWVLGSIVAVVALVWLGSVTGMDPITLAILGVAGFFALLGVAYVVLKAIDDREKAKLEQKYAIKPSLSPEKRKESEAIVAAARRAREQRASRAGS